MQCARVRSARSLISAKSAEPARAGAPGHGSAGRDALPHALIAAETSAPGLPLGECEATFAIEVEHSSWVATSKGGPDTVDVVTYACSASGLMAQRVVI